MRYKLNKARDTGAKLFNHFDIFNSLNVTLTYHTDRVDNSKAILAITVTRCEQENESPRRKPPPVDPPSIDTTGGEVGGGGRERHVFPLYNQSQ